MKRTETTIRALAEEARSYLERREGNREANGIGVILTGKDDKPEWVQQLCQEAHKDGSPGIMGEPGQGAMGPDDWRYEFIGDVLDCLSEEDDDIETASERFRQWFDGAYIYTHQRTAWLASRNDRYAYVDDAKEEIGDHLDTMTALWAGMFLEAEEVWAAVVSALEGRLGDLEDNGGES